MVRTRKELQKLTPYTPGTNKEGCIKLSSNENPLGPSQKAREAVVKASVAMQQYPDGNCTKLKNKLALIYGLKQENFILGNGADELILLTAAAFISAKDKALISRTTFSEYEYATRLFGGTPVFIPLKNNYYDLPAFGKKMSQKPKVVFLCNPNNPTGTIFTEKALITFMNTVSKNTIVVIDEAYNEYVQNIDYPNTLQLIETFPNLIILRTFSKIYGLAGLRIGYAVSTPEIIKQLNKAREPFNVNKLAQAAAYAALDDDSFIMKTIDINEEGKGFLYYELGKLELIYIKSEANFIYVDLPLPAKDIYYRMMAEGVIIRPLDSFGRPYAIRITIGTPWQNKRMIAALKKALIK